LSEIKNTTSASFDSK